MKKFVGTWGLDRLVTNKLIRLLCTASIILVMLMLASHKGNETLL